MSASDAWLAELEQKPVEKYSLHFYSIDINDNWFRHCDENILNQICTYTNDSSLTVGFYSRYHWNVVEE